MKTNQTIELPKTIEECHEMIKRLAARLAMYQRRCHGSLKDRSDAYDGPTLFDGEFKEAEMAHKEALEQAAKEVEAHARKRRASARKQQNENRPAKYHYQNLREEVRVILPEDINIDDYDIIGEDITRLLHYRAAELWVECIERPLLRAKSEKNATRVEIKQAKAPRAIIGGNHVAADMLAQLVVNKYSYHLPEYRQVRILKDLGLTMARSTINDWIHATANLLYPLYECQCEAVRAQGYLQVDEVPWKIADQKGKACRNGYAWQFRDVSPHNRGTFFYYYKGSRAGEIARAQLKGYQGAIQTDGYKVYDAFENVPGITTLACWAHARRKFVDAQDSNPQAGEVVQYIAALYALEENLKSEGATAEEIRQERQRLAVPILEGINMWMRLMLPQCTPQDPLAKAIKYTLGLWPRLTRYTENGLYQIDSNPVERGQRPTALGRKNYLFSQNNRGAEDNSIFYTFLVSCDILKINPLDWLTRTLEQIHPDMSDDQLINLLPYNYTNKKADL